MSGRLSAGLTAASHRVTQALDDTQLFSLSVTDDSNAWGFYSGSGIVALGNTMRVAFVSGATAGGNEAVGNFLDAADFGVGVGRVPEPTSLALVALALAAAARGSRHKS